MILEAKETLVLFHLWIAILVGTIVIGASIVGILALTRRGELFAALSGLSGIVVATWGILTIIAGRSTILSVVAAIGLSIAGTAGGYALASALLPYLKLRQQPLALPDIEPGTDSRTRILIAAHIEPERYDPRSIAEELALLAEVGLPETTPGIVPFFYAAQKARYRAAGNTSPSLKQAHFVRERLEALLEKETSVKLVTCSGCDTLPLAIYRALHEGYARIVVAPLSVGESFALNRMKSILDAYRPASHGLEILYAEPLWASDDLAEMLATQIRDHAEEPETTGVALVLQGQPEPWKRLHATFDIQENTFANRIRMLLSEQGIPEDRIRLCYADWCPPDVTETVRHLAALGCERVLVSPTCFPLESVTTILDLQIMVEQARVAEHVTTVILGAWGESDVTAAALRDALLACLAALPVPRL